MRKEFLLAQLLKDYEILFNKCKFIQLVIAGTIKINKQKRTAIMAQCKREGLKTWSELCDIMTKFIKDDKVKSRAIRNTSNKDDEGGDNSDPDAIANEETKEDEIPSKEYDYLLSMPLWSLTEERVNKLIADMNQKKSEHDTLEKRHIYDLWDEDLTKMLECLTKVEEQEERDRLQAGGVKNEGKKGRRKPVKAAAKAAAKSGDKPIKVPKAKAPAPKVDPHDLPLFERLALKQKEQTGSKSIYEGLTPAEAQALKQGPGHKRPADAVFKTLMQEANSDIVSQSLDS